MSGLKLTAALCAALVAASPATAQDAKTPLVGLWKLESLYTELKGKDEKRHTFGTKPKGYLYFSPDGRILSLLTAAERPKPKSDAEMAAALRTMYSIAGTYAAKGNSYTAKVEMAYNENLVGTELKRDFSTKGNQLTIVTAWGPSPLLQDNTEARTVTVWSRSK